MTPYYDDGNGIVIYHGDCRDVLPTIESASVALLIADPPYGIKAVQSNHRPRDGRDTKPGHVPGTWKAWDAIEGDGESFDPDPLLRFPRVALFGANNYADRLPPSPSWVVWDRLNGATPADNADAELIWTNLGGTVRAYRQCWRGFSRENDDLEPQRHLHPTQKPVNLMMWLLDRYTKPADLVVDPYMGSGPIAKACRLLGRRYIGIEIIEAYCRVTVETRLAQSVLPWEVAS